MIGSFSCERLPVLLGRGKYELAKLVLDKVKDPVYKLTGTSL